MNSRDEKYLKMTIALAQKGIGRVSPNPLVGTVILKNNKIISKGYHKYCGAPHAEIDAIKNAKQSLRGATLYVNLEPCAHFGRTPPCADQIIKAGIKRVVIAGKDVDVRTAGKGIKLLKKANIKVEVGLLRKQAREINSIYYFYKTNNRPYFVLKANEARNA